MRHNKQHMKKLIKVLKDSRGMTLIETMAATLLFGIVLAGLLNLSLGSMATGKRAEFTYSAYNIAKNHLESLRSMPYSTLANAAESDIYVDSNGTPDPDGDFIRTTAVTQNFNNDTNLIELDVSVDYIFRGSESGHPTELSTVVYQYA